MANKVDLPSVPGATIADIYLGLSSLGRIQNPHVRLNDFETKLNNNILERLN
jgi:hypothetical protein